MLFVKENTGLNFLHNCHLLQSRYDLGLHFDLDPFPLAIVLSDGQFSTALNPLICSIYICSKPFSGLLKL